MKTSHLKKRNSLAVLISLAVLLGSLGVGSASALDGRIDAGGEHKNTTELVIYRLAGRSANRDMYYHVSVDGQRIGKLKAGSSYTIRLQPGEHLITLNDRARTQLSMQLPARGRTYLAAEIDRHWRVHLSERQPDEKALAAIAYCGDSGRRYCGRVMLDRELAEGRRDAGEAPVNVGGLLNGVVSAASDESRFVGLRQ